MSRFPDPRYVRGDIIAIGDDLRAGTLRDAYRHGIFPWPHPDLEALPWFSPRRRAVIFFDELHVGRSLRKTMNRSELTFTIDRDFPAVIRACSRVPRPDQDGTWIEPEIIDAYIEFHRAGDAHSIEAWRGEELVGGLYGIDSGGVFTGESMFHLVPDASKLALLFLIERLNGTWIDCQVMTPHMEALGAREIARGKFLDLLAIAQSEGKALFR